MTTSTTIPESTATDTRGGLALYRRGGIERIARDLYIVPSRTRRRVEYFVDLERPSCECRDHQRTGRACLHVYAAMLYQAWLRRSARVVATSGAFDAGEDH
jgi:SWIM zinc finger